MCRTVINKVDWDGRLRLCLSDMVHLRAIRLWRYYKHIADEISWYDANNVKSYDRFRIKLSFFLTSTALRSAHFLFCGRQEWLDHSFPWTITKSDPRGDGFCSWTCQLWSCCWIVLVLDFNRSLESVPHLYFYYCNV